MCSFICLFVPFPSPSLKVIILLNPTKLNLLSFRHNPAGVLIWYNSFVIDDDDDDVDVDEDNNINKNKNNDNNQEDNHKGNNNKTSY